jgi:hypothetical protein
MREFVFNETMQVGIVVRDLDAAIRCDRNIRYGSRAAKSVTSAKRRMYLR